MNDLLVFAKNLLISSPLIALLLIAGLKLVRFNRFYHGEYAAFRVRLAANNNVHPSVRQRKENVVVGAIGAVTIAGLNEVIDDKNILLYFAGTILGMLAIWDLASLPSQIRVHRQWLNKLDTQDRVIYNQFKNYRRQLVLLITAFLIYGFLSLRFLP